MISLLLVALLAVLVYLDARKLGLRKGLVPGIGNASPANWSLVTLLVGIVGLPLYLFYRGRYKAAILAQRGIVPDSGYIGAIWIALAGLVAINFYAFSESPAPAPEASHVAPIALAATQLYAAYHANEVAADDRFKHRPLMVNGVVSSINKSFDGSVWIGLQDGDPIGVVQATVLASQEQQAASLSKGNEVTLLCVGDGMILGSPMLGRCRFASGGY